LAFWAIVGFNLFDVYKYFQDNKNAVTDEMRLFGVYTSTISTAAATSMILAPVLLAFMATIPTIMLHTGFLGCITMEIGFCVYYHLQNFIFLSILTGLIAFAMLLCYLFAIRSFQYTASLMAWTGKTLRRSPGIFLVNIFLMIFLVVALAGAAISGVYVVLIGTSSELIKGLSLFFVPFALLYQEEVFQNIGRVTAVGLFATNYYLGPKSDMLDSAVASSLSRALTYAFGSICFGSLLSSLLSFISYLAQTLQRQEGSLAAAIAQAVADILAKVMKYINTYAFTQVGIYGKSYMEAARDTLALLDKSGVVAIVNDNNLGLLITVATVFIALVASHVSSLYMDYRVDPDIFLSLEEAIFTTHLTSLFSFFIAAIICWCFFSVLRAGVTTLFVCMAQDMDALHQSDPELASEMVQRYPFLNCSERSA